MPPDFGSKLREIDFAVNDAMRVAEKAVRAVEALKKQVSALEKRKADFNLRSLHHEARLELAVPGSSQWFTGADHRSAAGVIAAAAARAARPAPTKKAPTKKTPKTKASKKKTPVKKARRSGVSRKLSAIVRAAERSQRTRRGSASASSAAATDSEADTSARTDNASDHQLLRTDNASDHQSSPMPQPSSSVNTERARNVAVVMLPSSLAESKAPRPTHARAGTSTARASGSGLTSRASGSGSKGRKTRFARSS